ncbi:hypothetical protein FRB96_007415 [Tulasnella sp. 330]|nr:hypothetical protein FRB96_007415 [Tulasnella sp. 330]
MSPVPALSCQSQLSSSHTVSTSFDEDAKSAYPESFEHAKSSPCANVFDELECGNARLLPGERPLVYVTRSDGMGPSLTREVDVTSSGMDMSLGGGLNWWSTLLEPEICKVALAHDSAVQVDGRKDMKTDDDDVTPRHSTDTTFLSMGNSKTIKPTIGSTIIKIPVTRGLLEEQALGGTPPMSDVLEQGQKQCNTSTVADGTSSEGEGVQREPAQVAIDGAAARETAV